ISAIAAVPSYSYQSAKGNGSAPSGTSAAAINTSAPPAAPVAPMTDARYDSESIQPCRVVDQNGLPHGSVRRPDRQLIHDAAIVDLQERRDVGSFPARDSGRVRVRPVGAPHDALHVRCDLRLGERRHVIVVWLGIR